MAIKCTFAATYSNDIFFIMNYKYTYYKCDEVEYEMAARQLESEYSDKYANIQIKTNFGLNAHSHHKAALAITIVGDLSVTYHTELDHVR